VQVHISDTLSGNFGGPTATLGRRLVVSRAQKREVFGADTSQSRRAPSSTKLREEIVA
jgi:hypothetical protein